MTYLTGHAVEAGAGLLADDAGPDHGAEVVARIGHVGRILDRDDRRPVDVAGRLRAGFCLAGDPRTGSRGGRGRRWWGQAVVGGRVNAMPTAVALAFQLGQHPSGLLRDDHLRRHRVIEFLARASRGAAGDAERLAIVGLRVGNGTTRRWVPFPFFRCGSGGWTF
jgi:hypothetical protein